MPKPNRVRLTILLLCASGMVTAYEQLSTEDLLARTAKTFLDSLSDQQRARAVLPFSDEKWQRWHYFPDGGFERTYTHGRPGLVYKEMTPPQRRLADALLGASLSQAGFIKAVTIMSLDDFLRTTGIEPLSDPERYYFCFFGTPSPEGTWRLRVEGHHISLNFTMKAGQLVSTSPTFLGSNPHEVREGSFSGMRVLGREEDLARDLLKSLSGDQRRLALIDDVAFPDIVTGVSLRAELEGSPRGLQGSKMGSPQWDALMSLVTEYAANVPPDITAQRMKAVEDTPRGEVYFAWAGSMEVGQGHYYRVQGPTFLVEYDNTLNNNNHSHTVWRNPKSDFGLDVFALHHRLYDHGLGAHAAD